MKSDLVDIAACRHAETESAIKISETNDASKAVWIPKSQCQIANDGHANFVTVTMPEWLAIEKGLV
ncbi:hypothetical protein [Rhizobium leguminosarum]|uniref:hypothetical protein n=1 Tax=Rhizobium leguminosarum TaxID=384 RepID=UPI000B928ED9|nr:hypothetical protein [Rhizobium leguminosarum]ASS56851.1 hypothetical protein CHR56_21105 [Rhizobium leguminosarum bv. viciae]MBY5804122.1 hypothetical protein [Rhizobium leguminosarum]NEI89545.1 hypothetical protein [Rhizobium leguminosarum]